MKEILDKIRAIRLEKGYTQEYIASKLGIDPVNYGRLERGQSKLTLERFIQICKILDVPPATFFNGGEQQIIEYLDKIYKVEHEILDLLKNKL
jgi:transcriptional regulator with XRE-family HTH domain